MTAFASGQDESYGALDLKRNYQFGLILALLGAVALHLAAIGGAHLYGHLTYTDPPLPVIRHPIPGSVIMSPPPIIRPEILKLFEPVCNMGPPVGIPVPRPDALVPEDLLLATRYEKRKLAIGVRGDSGTGGERTTRGTPMGEIGDQLFLELPPPDKFIPFEQAPEPIRRVMPEYPPLAKASGLSAAVVVRALVDRKGEVREVLLAHSSGSDAGFDEAAIEAVRQWLFKPAVNNDHPVAVWIYIPIRFELE